MGLTPSIDLREEDGRRLFDLRDPWQEQPTGPWGTQEMRVALEEIPSKGPSPISYSVSIADEIDSSSDVRLG